MIILVDQDGVIADFEYQLYERLKLILPPDELIHPFDRKSIYADDDYPPEFAAIIRKIIERPGFYGDMKPIDGAVEGVNKLIELGHDVRICTAPLKKFDHCVKEKYEWINRHFGAQMIEKTILTRDKTLVYGDFLIDDKVDIEGVGPRPWEHIVFGQPYNIGASNRAADWGDIVDQFSCIPHSATSIVSR